MVVLVMEKSKETHQSAHLSDKLTAPQLLVLAMVINGVELAEFESAGMPLIITFKADEIIH